ncbi:glycoside hydrolase family 76 protein [Aspergillus ruber CBS 135680]|uniref:Mannan endo-1,6-alpha-mannosidase n=1 Tax=Aspergillus ruber (strain CBS 135680) TaxID=1388766 RepID=A0A017S996_ASPRC|nr:glycosyl hydrolase family 76 protein [Aspergillus ruber CBS 135680]EYE93204.1 glycosyl hydrolase family 76 protein [Aspergillus ruber CBS 135680]
MLRTRQGWPCSRALLFLLLLLSLCVPDVRAIDLNIDDEQSIKDAASTAAYGMMTHYHGNETGQIPGKLPDTWWEGGAMFMTLIQYWYFTGDTTYNDEVSVGMQWQSGDGDYMPTNWSTYLGNDDQVFWGLAAMTAAELQYPEVDDGYSWLSLAQGVFNTQVDRWDSSTCDGGLRWQIYAYEAGYDMKNTISNGGLFQLSARLARYTNNDTYADWAEKIFDWAASTPLINNSTWNVADSTNIEDDCTSQGNNQWSYNYGTILSGAAYMYAYTNGTAKTKWQNAVNGLVNVTLDTFFPAKYDYVMSEICEPNEVCNNNEILFKGLTSAWLAFASVLVPSTSSQILPKLQSSAEAAAEACTGNSNNTCGVRWYTRTWDGWSGLEEQMSALSVFSSNLITTKDSTPVTSTTGGNSTSNPASGTNDKNAQGQTSPAVTTGDRAGAGVLTAVFALGWLGMMIWLVI